jgi:Double zinc ribbon
MKFCPQCRGMFEDDNIYCLADGNALIESDVEQETMVNRKFGFVAPVVVGTTGQTDFCSACGNENKADSKFCKKCGTAIAQSPAPMSPPFSFPQIDPESAAAHLDIHSPEVGINAFGETVTFRPPNLGTPASGVTPSITKRNLLIALTSVGLVLLTGTIYLFSSGESRKEQSKTSGSGNASNANTSLKDKDTTLRPTFTRRYSGDVAGQTLTMELTRNGGSLNGSATTLVKKDQLSGYIEDDGGFSLNAFETGHTGNWNGRINSDGSITGNWTKVGGSKPYPFNLTQDD